MSSKKKLDSKGKNKSQQAVDKEVETTGHEWDGIEEYNNPLPRWWLWTFYLTIIWGIGYMFVYPAWPLIESATPGFFKYSSRHELMKDIDHFKEQNKALDTAIINSDLASISSTPELAHYSNSGGAALFKTYCSQCHGAGAAGAKGYPNLLDDDWLWGGSLADIYTSIKHGIRFDGDDDMRFSEMPAFGDMLEPNEIDTLAHYISSLSGGKHDASLIASGPRLFQENCASCHGEEATGDPEQGAPNLRDAIWLYGNDLESLKQTITNSRNGVMPAWNSRLTEAQIKQLTYYVYQLGGGE